VKQITGVGRLKGSPTPVTKEKKFFEKIDSGFPHSTDVDNPEWIRNSAPPADAS
jgi:hypothetical protein